MIVAGVLAHQGGWDEILMVLTPISLFAGLLWMANRRANAQLQAPTSGDASERTDPDPAEAATADAETDVGPRD